MDMLAEQRVAFEQILRSIRIGLVVGREQFEDSHR
jgi:hypothetical protein